jgi:hypothetical protein
MNPREPIGSRMFSQALRNSAIAVATGIVVGAALVLLAPPVPAPANCSGSGNSPLQALLAVSLPNERTIGADHWYNFTVQSGGGVFEHRNLNFSVQNTSGAKVTSGAGWNFTAFDTAKATFATYSMYGPSAGTWTAGGSSTVWGGETWSLLASPTNLSGDNLVVLLDWTPPNGCPGSTGSTWVYIA